VETSLYYIGYFITAWMTADLITGFIHWIEDRYLKAEWPIVGKWIAAPNELHHAEPRAFLENNYWNRNNTTIIPALLAAAVFGYFQMWWWMTIALMTSQANELHACAHRGNNPLFIKTLQETGIVQNARMHAMHHVSPFATHFCALSSWLNPFLDRLNFWRALEYIVALFGIRVKS
jgi:hypothetical protein